MSSKRGRSQQKEKQSVEDNIYSPGSYYNSVFPLVMLANKLLLFDRGSSSPFIPLAVKL